VEPALNLDGPLSVTVVGRDAHRLAGVGDRGLELVRGVDRRPRDRDQPVAVRDIGRCGRRLGVTSPTA